MKIPVYVRTSADLPSEAAFFGHADHTELEEVRLLFDDSHDRKISDTEGNYLRGQTPYPLGGFTMARTRNGFELRYELIFEVSDE